MKNPTWQLASASRARKRSDRQPPVGHREGCLLAWLGAARCATGDPFVLLLEGRSRAPRGGRGEAGRRDGARGDRRAAPACRLAGRSPGRRARRRFDWSGTTCRAWPLLCESALEKDEPERALDCARTAASFACTEQLFSESFAAKRAAEPRARSETAAPQRGEVSGPAVAYDAAGAGRAGARVVSCRCRLVSCRCSYRLAGCRGCRMIACCLRATRWCGSACWCRCMGCR